MTTLIPDKVASALGLSSPSGGEDKVDPTSLASREKSLQDARRHSHLPASKDNALRVTPQSEIRTNPNLPMLAAEYNGKRSVVMRTRASPMVTDPKDAIIRTTSITLCGTDIHNYTGDVPGKPMMEGDIMGHESMGVVEAIGSEVKEFRVGDRVVVSAVLACGSCEFCLQGKTSYCLATNPSGAMETMMAARPAGMLGIGHPMGGFSGGQAERVRVPFADINLLRVPDGVTDVQALLLSDILCTAYHGLELGKLQEGQTIAIWGGGPVGQVSAYLAKKLYRASRVFLIDPHQYRLAFCQQWNVEPIDLSKVTDIAGTIQERTNGQGVDVCVDCAGFRFARSLTHKFMRAVGAETDTPEICQQMFMAVRPSGTCVLIGEYFGMANAFPVGHIMFKNLIVTGGPVFLHSYWHKLLKLIQDGTLDMVPFYSHTFGLSDLPRVYEMFANRKDNILKVFVQTDFGKSQGVATSGNILPIEGRMSALMAEQVPEEPQDSGAKKFDLHGLQLPLGLTAEEQRNVRLVVEYMNIAYNPTTASAANVTHLCAQPNRFISPTTFPEVHTLEQYAEAHGEMMKQLTDLHFESFDVLEVRGDRIALRYSATGTHLGQPHVGIPATHKTAHWTAAALFQCKDGKIVEFLKEWNKLPMWEQLGWPIEECLTLKK